MGYDKYIINHDTYIASLSKEVTTKLPSGVYTANYIPDLDKFYFETLDLGHDELLELPSKEFQTVATQIDKFLSPETKEVFKEYGFLYKRSILMHGLPGTGKTCLIDRVANKVINDGGIVIFNPHPAILDKTYRVLNNIEPDTNVLVIFEELDELLKHYEEDLLNILDGEVQRENVIYLATTNYIDEIPARIMRPGRFSSVVEVKYPDANARRFYLKHKLGKNTTKKEIDEIVKKTKGFSIDEVKETVLSNKCLDIELDVIIDRINETKELILASSQKKTSKYDLIQGGFQDLFSAGIDRIARS